MFYAVIKFISKLWLTGLLTLLAIPGYLFYWVLWVVRFMQSKTVLWWFAGVSVFVITIIVGMGFYFLYPFGTSDQQIEIIIPRKLSIHAVADSLQNQKIIRSSEVLLLWLKVTGKDRKIQAGKVVFTPGDGVLRAAEKLLNAVAIEKILKITEGLTVEQTAGKIQAQLGIDSSSSVRLCNDQDFVRKLNIESTTLEGYLFPDTYRFPEDVGAEDVLVKMVQQFNIAYDRIEKDSLIQSKFTRHQIVTLASIVEKEATLADERSRIAGVFHNRIKKRYPLGADPTVRYIFRKFSGPLRVSELNSNSPYNTRKFAGLPPGPICSPGYGALQATVSPLITDDLYFVAKWDGSGAHDFSRTNQEHERKKIMIRHENERRLRGK